MTGNVILFSWIDVLAEYKISLSDLLDSAVQFKGIETFIGEFIVS